MIQVGLGAGIGSLMRYIMTSLIKQRVRHNFPVATLIINIIGAFCLGYLKAIHLQNETDLLLGTGFLGGFTTFSTFQVESVGLLDEKRMVHLGGYLLLTYGCGLIAAYIGMVLGNFSR